MVFLKLCLFPTHDGFHLFLLLVEHTAAVMIVLEDPAVLKGQEQPGLQRFLEGGIPDVDVRIR